MFIPPPCPCEGRAISSDQAQKQELRKNAAPQMAHGWFLCTNSNAGTPSTVYGYTKLPGEVQTLCTPLSTLR